MKRYISLTLAILAIAFSTAQNMASEDHLLMNDSIQLPGTLSYDKALKQQPLVIFIHGSGNVDRDGNQMGMNANASYIKQLSEALNQNGIAFYRYDKRTATMSNMKFLMQGISFDGFVEDAKIAIAQFKDDQRFSSITLIGHSQGSLVAMLAADAHVDKYVSLAGPAQSIDVTITDQIRTQSGDSIAAIVDSHFRELKANSTIAKVDPNLMALFYKPNQPFLVSWMQYTPSEVIATLTLPALILNGTKDLQVAVEDARALNKALPSSELVLIDDMNHVLKTITQDEDNLKSYSTADFPLSEQLVTTLTAFIKQ